MKKTETDATQDTRAEAEAAAPKPNELRNSLWCVDKAGRVGLIDSISGSDALFRYSEKTDEGRKLGDLIRVPLAELTQAKVAELPENHGMAPAEVEALGYLS